jgi:ArsR family transcriptional regulator, arsenate/arsenite/antimonite-responsive transcriptional repressor
MSSLNEMESMFLALADKTRLRLLNLMANGEVCVALFTEILGVSQPKISRHLAYLRNAHLVDVRREGKWMHYSVRWPDDEGRRAVLQTTLNALADVPGLLQDRARLTTDPFPTENGHRNIALTERQTQEMESFEPLPPVSSPRHNELEEFLL